jgi:hypothetical protein
MFSTSFVKVMIISADLCDKKESGESPYCAFIRKNETGKSSLFKLLFICFFPNSAPEKRLNGEKKVSVRHAVTQM